MMKKLISILLATLFLFSFALAESEITFQTIPWLSDDVSTFQLLEEAGFVRNGVSSLIFKKDDPIYIVVDDMGFSSPDQVSGAEDVTFSVDLDCSVKGKIGGWPVKDLVLTFAYDGSYKLIAVKVDLINASYDDLRGKLNRVYGDGELTTTEEGIDSIVWKGENRSAVVLYTQSEGQNYTLIYGRLDAAEILSKCLETTNDDISGL